MMAQILPYRQKQPIGAAKTYTTLGHRAFQVAARKLWNNLPFILILEVHYFYHRLRRIFLEKHSLNTLIVYTTYTIFFLILRPISSHTVDHWFLESNG